MIKPTIGHHLKHKKVMLPRLKCKIFRFWSKFVLLTKLSTQQIQFPKIHLCHLLVYVTKNTHAKNLENPLRKSWEKCVTDGQIEKWTEDHDGL